MGRLSIITLGFLLLDLVQTAHARCRAEPGKFTWPSQHEWNALNNTVNGRLNSVVPSAKACAELGCGDAEWFSAVFRNGIPGQMNSYNWEQNYTSIPPELCLHNETQNGCAQGNVPLFAINATTPRHIQAGVVFASRHNLRVAIKSSGHDFLGRSTARESLLLWTQHFQNITFTDSFMVNGKNLGSAVTVGSGVGLKAIYQAAKLENKMFVGGTAATVSAGGGYIQGAGHSAFSPTFGLAADNALGYEIVLANGSYVVANEASHSDLFWALRGGGAGSWGVIISVTMRTYPVFNATIHTTNILFNSSDIAAAAMTIHARHIFDYDSLRAGQYFYVYPAGSQSLLQMNTLFVNVSTADAQSSVAPFIQDVQTVGAQLINETVISALANDIVGFSDDLAGYNVILGSRLVPATAYRANPDGIGAAYKTLLDQGVNSILGHLVAGGKVAENANIDSAVQPKWRSAKAHVIVTQTWSDSTSPNDILSIKKTMTTTNVPVLASITGDSDSGAYSNEADVNEPDFQTTFFGTNYARLSAIKALYDPHDLFIVGAGVGSERWDAAGFCTV